MRTATLGLSVLLVSGCTALDPTAAFNSVARTVEERTGQRVVWNQGTTEDLEVHKRIEELLSGTLTVDEAVEVSLLNNPKLQAEYEELGIAQAEVVKAGLLDNPLISLERRFRGRAAEIDIAQNFLGVFLIPLRTKAAKADAEVIIHTITQEVLNHTAEVKTAFYSLQGEQQILEMRKSVVAALEASYEVSIALHKAGNAAALDVHNEANMLAQAKLELAEASVRVLEERECLNVLLGAWGGNTLWKIAQRLPDLPTREISLPRLESYAVTHRLDLAAAKRGLEVIATEVGISRYEALIPSLTIGGHFEREPDGNSSRGPSIEFPLPVFNWGEAASAEGNARVRQALRRYEALAIDTRSKVRVAYGRMKAARVRAEYLYKEVLPLQKRTLEQVQLFYNGMFLGVFQLLQAKQAQIAVGQSYIASLKEYWLARTELEQIVGGTLKELPVTNETINPTAIVESQRTPALGAHHDH